MFHLISSSFLYFPPKCLLHSFTLQRAAQLYSAAATQSAPAVFLDQCTGAAWQSKALAW